MRKGTSILEGIDWTRRSGLGESLAGGSVTGPTCERDPLYSRAWTGSGESLAGGSVTGPTCERDPVYLRAWTGPREVKDSTLPRWLRVDRTKHPIPDQPFSSQCKH